MCQKRLTERTMKDQVGTWHKGNEYRPMQFKVDIVPCACGKLWATMDGKKFVECDIQGVK